jgi:hypothetical protein
MKRSVAFAMMLTILSAPAFASGNSQTVNVPEPMKAGSTQLAPGDYNVTWTGTGPNVQVTFAHNRKVIVIVPAKLVEEGNKYEGLLTNKQGGVETLESIQLRKVSLILEGSSSSEK